MAYDPNTVSLLNKAREDAVNAGTSARGGNLKDYATFASTLNTPVSSAYKDITGLGLNTKQSQEDGLYGNLLKNAYSTATSQVNENDIYTIKNLINIKLKSMQLIEYMRKD